MLTGSAGVSFHGFWARITIGVIAELAFLAYVYVLGGRAARAGETGDLEAFERSADVPTAA